LPVKPSWFESDFEGGSLERPDLEVRKEVEDLYEEWPEMEEVVHDKVSKITTPTASQTSSHTVGAIEAYVTRQPYEVGIGSGAGVVIIILVRFLNVKPFKTNFQDISRTYPFHNKE